MDRPSSSLVNNLVFNACILLSVYTAPSTTHAFTWAEREERTASFCNNNAQHALQTLTAAQATTAGARVFDYPDLSAGTYPTPTLLEHIPAKMIWKQVVQDTNLPHSSTVPTVGTPMKLVSTLVAEDVNFGCDPPKVTYCGERGCKGDDSAYNTTTCGPSHRLTLEDSSKYGTISFGGCQPSPTQRQNN